MFALGPLAQAEGAQSAAGAPASDAAAAAEQQTMCIMQHPYGTSNSTQRARPASASRQHLPAGACGRDIMGPARSACVSPVQKQQQYAAVHAVCYNPSALPESPSSRTPLGLQQLLETAEARAAAVTLGSSPGQLEQHAAVQHAQCSCAAAAAAEHAQLPGSQAGSSIRRGSQLDTIAEHAEVSAQETGGHVTDDAEAFT